MADIHASGYMHNSDYTASYFYGNHHRCLIDVLGFHCTHFYTEDFHIAQNLGTFALKFCTVELFPGPFRSTMIEFLRIRLGFYVNLYVLILRRWLQL